MKKGLLLLAVFTVGVLLASCKKDPPPLVENPNLIFNPKGVQSLNIDQGPETTPFTVNILRTMGRDKAVTVNLAIDETRLPTGKKLLDAKYYTIDNLAVPMASGSGSVSFTVTFKSELMFDEITDEAEWDDYAVPVSIASVSPEFPVVADDTFVVINATLRGATIISEGAEEFAEVSPSGEDGTVELLAKANFSADASKVSYTVDEAGVAAYNTENETELTLLPSSAYSVGTGAWSTTEEDTDDDPNTDPVEVDVIANTITINKSVAAGIYLLPLKITTSEEGVEVEQAEPIYILVESVPAATPAQVTNGDFEAPLPYSLTSGGYAYIGDVIAGPPGIWRNKPGWWSTWGATTTTIYPGQGFDGDCAVIECPAPETVDYVLVQKVVGLDPANMYTLSAKIKLTDISDESKSGGIRLGYWPKGVTSDDSNSAVYGTAYKDFTGAWGDVSCVIGSINDDGSTIICVRFGGNSADTDGKAWLDNIKIEEYDPDITGELKNGDLEATVSTSYAGIGNDPTAYIDGLLAGEWKVFSGWNLAYAVSGNGGVYYLDEGRNGSKCVKIATRTDVESSLDGGVIQKINGLTPGDVYTFSAWVKITGLTKEASGTFAHHAGARCVWWEPIAGNKFQDRPTSSEAIRVADDWTQVSLNVTVPESGEVTIGVRYGGTNADVNGTVWIDDATFVKQ